jgi:hypothetical protein
LGQPVVDYLTLELGRGHVKSVYITGGQETPSISTSYTCRRRSLSVCS